MKVSASIVLSLSVFPQYEAFVPLNDRMNRVSFKGSSLNEPQLEKVQNKWVEESIHLNSIEHSVEDDPYLSNVVETSKSVATEFMEHEAHRHDSFLNEVEHSIDNDPDLFNIVNAPQEPAEVNYYFREQEAHVHDSLLSEIEHAINSDPDLAGITHN